MQTVCDRGGLSPAVHAELGEDPGDVHADAVFSAMYSDAPIWRLVAPCATSASTWRSRGVSPNGSSCPAAGSAAARPSRSAPSAVRRARSTSPRSSPPSQPAPSRSVIASAAAATSAACGPLAVLDQRLGLAAIAHRRRVGPLERLPCGRRLGPRRRVVAPSRARQLGEAERLPRPLDRAAALRRRLAAAACGCARGRARRGRRRVRAGHARAGRGRPRP